MNDGRTVVREAEVRHTADVGEAVGHTPVGEEADIGRLAEEEEAAVDSIRPAGEDSRLEAEDSALPVAEDTGRILAEAVLLKRRQNIVCQSLRAGLLTAVRLTIAVVGHYRRCLEFFSELDRLNLQDCSVGTTIEECR